MNIIKPGKEEIPPDELTIEHIRNLVTRFNELYEAGAAYKGYEFQMLEVLLARIDELERDVEEIDKALRGGFDTDD